MKTLTDPELQTLKSELKKLDWSDEAVELGVAQDFRCFYCRRDLLATIEDYDVWQIDHVIPTAKNGPNEFANKVVACKLCNFCKGAFDPSENVGVSATMEDLRKAALDHVKQVRSEKQLKLERIREIVFRHDCFSRTTSPEFQAPISSP